MFNGRKLQKFLLVAKYRPRDNTTSVYSKANVLPDVHLVANILYG